MREPQTRGAWAQGVFDHSADRLLKRRHLQLSSGLRTGHGTRARDGGLTIPRSCAHVGWTVPECSTDGFRGPALGSSTGRPRSRRRQSDDFVSDRTCASHSYIRSMSRAMDSSRLFHGRAPGTSPGVVRGLVPTNSVRHPNGYGRELRLNEHPISCLGKEFHSQAIQRQDRTSQPFSRARSPENELFPSPCLTLT